MKTEGGASGRVSWLTLGYMGSVSNEPTQQTAFRLPVSLLGRLDHHVEHLRAEQPGMNITRADVVRLLLTRALDELEAAEAGSKASTRRRR